MVGAGSGLLFTSKRDRRATQLALRGLWRRHYAAPKSRILRSHRPGTGNTAAGMARLMRSVEQLLGREAPPAVLVVSFFRWAPPMPSDRAPLNRYHQLVETRMLTHRWQRRRPTAVPVSMK